MNPTLGAFGIVLSLGTPFWKYLPGPTILPVEELGANGDWPRISLRNPKVYFGSEGASGLNPGLYSGPGVWFNTLGFSGNYIW